MGSIISRIRLCLDTLKEIAASYKEISKRLDQSPGIPFPNPTTPFWAVPTSNIAREGSEKPLPGWADVVIIGSGIAGTSFAREFLDNSDGSPSVVMLEARDVCYGATARNGGHITPQLYHEYQLLEKQVGVDAAKSIIRFRRAHLPALLKVAEEEGLLEDSQCRTVETHDVFFEQSVFESMKSKLDYFLEAFPEERGLWSTDVGSHISSKMQLSDQVYGVITTHGGAVHPYRLVTGILTRLLKTHSSFKLFTHTSCTSIEATSDAYLVATPRGTIRTKNVIHATNSWASHLLVPMRRKIVPIRGHMTAQRPGHGLGLPVDDSSDTDSQATISSTWLGTRSFVLYPSKSEDRWDYLTQQAQTGDSTALGAKPHAEFMFGGALEAGSSGFMDAVGCVDDRSLHFPTSAYLGGALPQYFGRYWGVEGSDEDEGFDAGRVKKAWSGILGISADRLPWVGLLPPKISGRQSIEGGGEWIAAGFTGEGMTHAWLSAKALALMVAGHTETGIPDVFLISEKRWKNANIEQWL